ncbi:MAG TPA: alpha-hydroxy-acid oxidizing protein, partial [Aeromicrobium sp.]|nr:alpha-hydroxy-acid oxidizing protein [Aeromicrobium sp.]
DGGIRRGSDIAVALALGADAVLIGRPVLWGLATGGEQGVIDVLSQLVEELQNTLALVGCPSVRQLDRSFLATLP